MLVGVMIDSTRQMSLVWCERPNGKFEFHQNNHSHQSSRIVATSQKCSWSWRMSEWVSEWDWVERMDREDWNGGKRSQVKVLSQHSNPTIHSTMLSSLPFPSISFPYPFCAERYLCSILSLSLSCVSEIVGCWSWVCGWGGRLKSSCNKKKCDNPIGIPDNSFWSTFLLPLSLLMLLVLFQCCSQRISLGLFFSLSFRPSDSTPAANQSINQSLDHILNQINQTIPNTQRVNTEEEEGTHDKREREGDDMSRIDDSYSFDWWNLHSINCWLIFKAEECNERTSSTPSFTPVPLPSLFYPCPSFLVLLFLVSMLSRVTLSVTRSRLVHSSSILRSASVAHSSQRVHIARQFHATNKINIQQPIQKTASTATLTVSSSTSSKTSSIPPWAASLVAIGGLLAFVNLADDENPIVQTLTLRKLAYACGIVAFVGEEPATPYLLEVRWHTLSPELNSL